MKKSFIKRLTALALVIVSVFSISAVAFAASAWIDRYGEATLYSNTEGDVNGYVRNVQRDLNKYFSNYDEYQIDVDGYYGDDTKAAVKLFQSKTGLTSDGWCGDKTKDMLWKVYKGTLDPLK